MCVCVCVCVEAKGWAVESRVYAEDPLRGFLPSIGPLVTYVEPQLKLTDGASDLHIYFIRYALHPPCPVVGNIAA